MFKSTKKEKNKIPHGIETIEGKDFEDFSSARSITIPDGVAEIGPATFAGCTKLANIVIPESVISIGDYAFRGSITHGAEPRGLAEAEP